MSHPHQHQIRLSGAGLDGRTIQARLFRDLVDLLIEGARKALRLRLQGTSTPGGREPHWLKPAADFDLYFPENGEAIAVIKAKPLSVTLPSLFEQRSFFDELDPNKSPVDLFEDAIEDAIQQVDDSTNYDAGLLQTMTGFTDLFGSGRLDSLQLVNGRTLLVDPVTMGRAAQLAERTRQPEPVYVVGHLEGITYSDCRFKLMLPDKTPILGDAVDVGNAPLRKLWGKRVVVQGKVHFRPSGAMARVEADSIEAVSDEHVADAFKVLGRDLTLSEGESKTFLKLLESPPAPSPALRDAWRRHAK